MVVWVDLHCVNAVFPDHTHLLLDNSNSVICCSFSKRKSSPNFVSCMPYGTLVYLPMLLAIVYERPSTFHGQC